MPRSMMLMQSLTPTINFYAYPVKKIPHNKTGIKDKLFYYFLLTEEYIKYLLSFIIIVVK